MTVKYLEYATNLQCAEAVEWIGREYARDELANRLNENWVGYPYAQQHYAQTGSYYPVPPGDLGGKPEPAPVDFTWYYAPPVPMLPSGGVLVIYEEIQRFATQPQTLSNGQVFSVDLAVAAVEFSALSTAAQTALQEAGMV